MNINLTVKCDGCGENTNCRVGLSNRPAQALRFCCSDCGSPIDIILGSKKGDIKGAEQVHDTGPFDDETNFVDLHLDFPVHFGKYIMGHTPFMRAAQRIGPEEFQIHNARLNYLNAHYKEFSFFKTLLKFYMREKIGPFKNAIKNKFGGNVVSDKDEDINAALYDAIATVMWPFAYPGEDAVSVDHYLQTIHQISQDKKEAMDSFIDEILQTGFLKNLQHDCLEIYPRILDAELPMRPVLFLDFDEDYRDNAIPMRVSIDDFGSYKDLYKDIAEIISRQFVLVAGVNNIIKRDDHNSFLPGIGLAASGRDFTPRNLNTFADVDFGKKQDFIDDSWYAMSDDAADNQLRNAIAHFKTEYDDVTQKILYYPRREGIQQERSEEIYFIEFMRRILIGYREMHRLHQLIKCLFYYHYLIPR